MALKNKLNFTPGSFFRLTKKLLKPLTTWRLLACQIDQNGMGWVWGVTDHPTRYVTIVTPYVTPIASPRPHYSVTRQAEGRRL